MASRSLRADVPLDDDERISGSRTDTLVIRNAQHADAGIYDLHVSNPCGQDASPAATLTIQCTADFNCDGDFGTDQDIEAFFACLAGTCPPAPCTSSADFNGDGDFGTDQDIEAFFRVLAGSPC